MKRIDIVVVLMALSVATPAMAQGRGRGNGGVPPGQRPAAGMCRVWIDGLPPGQQPAPTDCRTANARVPRNGQVIYGDQTDPRNRRIYQSNGQVVRTNGQQCVQRADRNGVLRTICADGDHDRDDRIVARAAQDDRRFDQNAVNGKKHKKHKYKNKDRDQDERNDRNERDRR
jgi:hypothetical protein